MRESNREKKNGCFGRREVVNRNRGKVRGGNYILRKSNYKTSHIMIEASKERVMKEREAIVWLRK